MALGKRSQGRPTNLTRGLLDGLGNLLVMMEFFEIAGNSGGTQKKKFSIITTAAIGVIVFEQTVVC